MEFVQSVVGKGTRQQIHGNDTGDTEGQRH